MILKVHVDARAVVDTSPLTPVFVWPVAVSAKGLEADAAGGAARLGRPGSVHYVSSGLQNPKYSPVKKNEAYLSFGWGKQF